MRQVILIVFVFCVQTAFAQSTGNNVYFKSPKNNAHVSQKFKVRFGLSGMQIKPAGSLMENTGHHHLIIDGDFIPKGEIVPADKAHLHFGKGQKETEIELPKGKHHLTLQFADGSHISYGKEMSQTIEIMVE